MSLTEEDEEAFRALLLRSHEWRMIAPPMDGEPFTQFPPASVSRDDLVWDGYLEASAILLRECVASDRSASRLIFPALFNLRHGIEVALKYHIECAGRVLPKGVGHNINLLVEIFRETAAHLPEEISYTNGYDLDRAAEIGQIDPRAVAFRYSKNIDGSFIKVDIGNIGLVRLRMEVESLREYFYDLFDRMALCMHEEYVAQYR